MEDREVESKAKFNLGTGWQRDSTGFCVSFAGFLRHFAKRDVLAILCHVAIVVSNHFNEEALSLAFAGLTEDVILNQIDDMRAVIVH